LAIIFIYYGDNYKLELFHVIILWLNE